jgi:hypothetical protein
MLALNCQELSCLVWICHRRISRTGCAATLANLRSCRVSGLDVAMASGAEMNRLAVARSCACWQQDFPDFTEPAMSLFSLVSRHTLPHFRCREPPILVELQMGGCTRGTGGAPPPHLEPWDRSGGL